jgi:hypothetical protein
VAETTLPVKSSVHPSGIPANESNAVVVGTVTERHAYLGDGNRGVYSEFAIQIDQVLKATDSVGQMGKNVIAQRLGGIVRFQDGTLQKYVVAHQDWPTVRRRYVLFLKKSQTGDFDLLTAYELCPGFTQPLDGAGDGSLSFHLYSGMKESDFLSAVRDAINGKESQ